VRSSSGRLINSPPASIHALRAHSLIPIACGLIPVASMAAASSDTLRKGKPRPSTSGARGDFNTRPAPDPGMDSTVERGLCWSTQGRMPGSAPAPTTSDYPVSASACSSQYAMSISRYIARRDGEVLLSLTGIAHAVMHLAETEVAVGNERTHAAGLGERQRLAVVAFGVLAAGYGGDVTVEAEGMGFVSPSPQPAGERQGLSGVGGRLIDPPN